MKRYMIPAGTVVWKGLLYIYSTAKGQPTWNLKYHPVAVKTVVDWYFTDKNRFDGFPNDNFDIHNAIPVTVPKDNMGHILVVVLPIPDRTAHDTNVFIVEQKHIKNMG